MSIEEELTLNISGALSEIETVESAVEALGTPVELTLDTSAAEGEVGLFTSDLEANEAALPITADVSQGEEQLSLFAADVEGLEPEVVVGVTVDGAEEAQSQIDGLGDSLGDAGDKGDSAAGGFDAASSGLEALGLASVAGSGGIGGVSSSLAGLGSVSAGATAGIVGVAAGIGYATSAAIEAEDAQSVYNQALGDMTSELDQLEFEGFNTSLEDLAINLGSSDEALKLATARLVTFGKSSGATDTQIAKTTQQMLGLGAGAFALNPALGSVDASVTGLAKGLGRGGRALVAYGLDISAAEIQTRALADTGKTSADQLTTYEKQVAGTTIAWERYGDTIGSVITNRQDVLAVKIEATKQRLGELTEAIGTSLLPAMDSLTTSTNNIVTDLQSIGGESGKAGSGVDVLGTSFEVLGNVAKVTSGVAYTEAVLNWAAGSDKANQNITLFSGTLDELQPKLISAQTGLGASATTLEALALTAETAGGQIHDSLVNATTIEEANQNLSDFRDSYEDYQNAILAASREGNQALLDEIVAAGPVKGQALADSLNAASAEERKALETNLDQTNAIVAEGTATMVATAETGLEPLPVVAETAAAETTRRFDAGLGIVGKIQGEIGQTVAEVGAMGPSLSASGQAAGAAGTAGVVTGFGDLSGQIYEIGTTTGPGLAAGIDANADQARAAARRMADDVMNIIRDAVRPGSPSKVTTLLGEQIADGLAVGMEAHMPSVASAASALAGAAIPDVLTQAAGVVNGSAIGGGGAIQVVVNVESNGDDNTARRFGSIVGESALTVIERNQAAMQIRAGSGA